MLGTLPAFPPSRRPLASGHTSWPLAFFLVLLAVGWPWPGSAADCPADRGLAGEYRAESGQLSLPRVEVRDVAGGLLGHYRAELRLGQNTEDGGIWFDLTESIPVSNPDSPPRARFQVASGRLSLEGYTLSGGLAQGLYEVGLQFDPGSGRFLLTDLAPRPSEPLPSPQGRVYRGEENVFSLKRGGANQFLLPVEIGNQTLNLLVDTGSDALLVFEDRISACNEAVRVTETPVTQSYASGSRRGVLGIAPVRLGAYSHPAMRIMLARQPSSQNDPSLTAKGADGIIGLRRTPGLNFTPDSLDLDAALTRLAPRIERLEFNLPPAGPATLSLGHAPLLDRADESLLFRAKALNLANPNQRAGGPRFADMQIPFRAKTAYGEAADPDLDILLDTGAVSRLVLDTRVAEQLGYDPVSGEWRIDENQELELNLLGLDQTTTLHPKFKLWEVSVAPYGELGVEFEAVLGISRWQDYVVGFDFVPDERGGPDGTVSLLRRADLTAAAESPTLHANFAPLPGLNSPGNEEFPSLNRDASLLAFQSDRRGGENGVDVYVWRRDAGLLDPPGLNTPANETHPVLSADGRLLAYESDADGNLDLRLYDLARQQPVDMDFLNSPVADYRPALDGDGGHLAFVSRRGGQADIYVYDTRAGTYLELPGVNSDWEESAPALSDDGRFLSFARDTRRENGEQVLIYDLQARELLPLSEGQRGINTPFDEQAPALNLNPPRLAFHGNRKNPRLGLYDRDVFVVDMLTQIPQAHPGLNSEFDDIHPRFSGDGQWLVFQSTRPGGAGGYDLYLYRGNDSTPPTTAEPKAQEIAFTRGGGAQFSAPVEVAGQDMNLLVDMRFNALIIFRDRATGFADSGQTVGVNLGAGRVVGSLARAGVRLGAHQAELQLVIVERADCEAALLGLSTAGLDGILGLGMNPPAPPTDANSTASGGPANLPSVPLKTLQPAINLLELNFGEQPGLTLNRLPATGGNPHAWYTGISGVRPPGQPAYTETRIPFVALGYRTDDPLPATRAGGPEAPPRAALSSLLNQHLVLDTEVARELGYQPASRSWGEIQSLDLSFLMQGSDVLLPAARQVPVSLVYVLDLSDMDALLGRAYWSRYVLGIDYLSDHGSAVLFLADQGRPEVQAAGPDRHFIPLAGLNSVADEEYGSMSLETGRIAFQSNRGDGDYDIYLWQVGQGVMEPKGLNSPQAEQRPSLSGDGRLLAFQSLRHGQPDIFLYDLESQSLVELPGLNTQASEEHPTLSADGQLLAYTLRREGTGKGAEVYVYDLARKQPSRVRAGWLNTHGDEQEPTLSGDGGLLAFAGSKRPDGLGGFDVYLYNLNRERLLELPRLGSRFTEANPAFSADGQFLAFFSNRNAPDMAHLGNDIFLAELSSGELLDLPGLNSAHEDVGPALGPNGEFILFQSKRPGGAGGYDLYLYHRDLEDNTRYQVSEGYREDGQVTDDQGRPLAGVGVRASDGDGNPLADAVTDRRGEFTLDIPMGALLPITYTSPQGRVVIDEVGDETYVPDFEAGNLSFTEVWVEDTLQAGMPSQIWFDVATEMPKYNVHVKLYLVKLPGGDIDSLTLDNFTPDYSLTALEIPQLGQAGSGEPVRHTQGQDRVTEITYTSEDNRRAHVEHRFIVPPQVEDGTYAAVFSIGRFDYHPEDDALQSEDLADQQDNYLAAPASVIVGQPDKPNLRILSAELNSNSLELPASRPSADSTPFSSDLTLNLEVESMARDTEAPVEIRFALELDGQYYPLTFADNQGRRPSKLEQKIYPVTCRAEDREGYPPGERCASLFRQEQQGYTYRLYLSPEAYDALAAKEQDSLAHLMILLDPAGHIEEWEDNTADNVRAMPVMYLPPDGTARTARRAPRGLSNTLGSYSNSLFSLSEEELYGSDDFGAGYAFNAGLSYEQGSYNNISYPYAAALDGTGNRAYVSIFGYQIDMLSVDVGADINGDKIICSWFEYDVDVLEMDKYAADYSVDDIDVNDASCDPSGDGSDTSETTQSYTLWSSQDDDGNELYTLSKSKEYSQSFSVGPIPITVSAGATGNLGIRGDVAIDTTNTLMVEVGPYLELSGYAEGGVGISVANAGVGIELLVLGVDLPFTLDLQVLPSYPLAILTFEAPLILSTLDGEFYLYAKILWDKYTYTIVEWEGLEWEIPLIDPVRLVWAEVNQFVGQIDGVTDVTSALDYEWDMMSDPSSFSSFTAWWQGDFNFEAGTYTLVADTDDYLTVSLDSDGDGDYDSSLFNLTEDEAPDLAGGDDSGELAGDITWLDSDALSSAGAPGSLEFDGSGDYLKLDTHPVSATVGTIEHWVKITEDDKHHILVYTGDDSGSEYNGYGHEDSSMVEIHTAVDESNKARFIFQQLNSEDAVKLSSDSSLSVGEWYHIAVTYDYQGDIKLYLNGELEDSASAAGYGFGSRDGDNTYIGRPIDDSSSRSFKGALDEVRIWNVVRTQSEIQADMSNRLNGNEEGLVAYYSFDKPGTGTVTAEVEVAEDDTLGLDVVYQNATPSILSYLSLSWGKTNSFTASYYNSTDFSGEVVWTEVENSIDHDWGAASPDGEEGMVNADGFSAIWEGSFSFDELQGSEQYAFVVNSDDSEVELYLDGSQVGLSAALDEDVYYGLTTLSADSHTLKLRYSHDSGDAKIRLAWLPVNKWRVAHYFRDDDDWQEADIPPVVIRAEDLNGAGDNTGVEDYDMLRRYAGIFHFDSAGDYDFIVRIDDGLKLYVDGVEYLGHWGIDAGTAYIVPINLTAGYHLIEVEHYDEIGADNNHWVRELEWSPRQTNEFIGFYYRTLADLEADDPWDAENYDGTEPLLIRKSSATVSGCSFTATSLDCDWSQSSPLVDLEGMDSSYLNTDGFGARWLGEFEFEQGVYLFTVREDDGARLWVDDIALVDEWDEPADTRTYQEAVPLDEGTHSLRLEYWENSGDADVSLDWSEINANTFNVQYFDSTNLSGVPTEGGEVSTLDYSGGADSARWVGVFEFLETDYRFTVNTDGGVRVYLDGQAIIDQWTAQDSAVEYTATLAVEEGFHSLKVEYFEGNSGSPGISLSWLSTSEIAGNALEFDGVDDYVELPFILDPAATDEFTVELWVRPDDVSRLNGLVRQTYGTGTGRAWLYLNNTGRVATLLGNSWAISSNALVAGNWHHLALVYDNGRRKIYLDGELEVSDTLTPEACDGTMRLGQNDALDGALDELRIWGEARSQAEIRDWMHSTLSGEEANLLAYYSFDQSSGTTVTDGSGNYDGSLNGDPQWATSNALLTEMAPPGGALEFDGSDDYVDLNAGMIELAQGDFTLEAWIQTTGNKQAIITSNDGDSRWEQGEKAFYLDANGRVYFVGWGNGYIQGATPANDGDWHHVAVVWDYAAGSGKIYLDGEDDTASSGYAANNANNAGDTLKLAFPNYSEAPNHFNGRLDEVRVWNVARSPAEIQSYLDRVLDRNESGLLAYYRFDEVAGSTATRLTDSWGGYDGSLQGDPDWVSSGAMLTRLTAPGNAMSLDGSDDYVDLNAGIIELAQADFTLEAWIQTSGTGQAIITSNDGDSSWGQGEKTFYLDANGRVYFVGWGNGYIQGATPANDGDWHHVAVVWDYAAGSGKIYLDGEDDTASSSYAANNANNAGDTLKLAFPNYNNGEAPNYFNGRLDEVRIWSSARSQAEIQANMSTTVGSFETGLLAYYRFDQDSGTELVDMTSHDYDGILNGNPTWVTSTVPMD